MTTIIAVALLVLAAFYRKWEHKVPGTCFAFNIPWPTMWASLTKPVSIGAKKVELSVAAVALGIVLVASEVLFYESGGMGYVTVANGIALWTAYHGKRQPAPAQKSDAA